MQTIVFPLVLSWNGWKVPLWIRGLRFFFPLSSSGRIISCKWCSILPNRRWLISQTEQPNQSASSASYIRSEGPGGACLLHHCRSDTVVRNGRETFCFLVCVWYNLWCLCGSSFHTVQISIYPSQGGILSELLICDFNSIFICSSCWIFIIYYRISFHAQ